MRVCKRDPLHNFPFVWNTHSRVGLLPYGFTLRNVLLLLMKWHAQQDLWVLSHFLSSTVGIQIIYMTAKISLFMVSSQKSQAGWFMIYFSRIYPRFFHRLVALWFFSAMLLSLFINNTLLEFE